MRKYKELPANTVMEFNRIILGDIREMVSTLPSQSVNTIVTSPPYWGLRDYGTAKWVGGDEGCDHQKDRIKGIESSTLGGGKGSVNHQHEAAYKTTCAKCGAKRVDKQLGLEETPEAYVSELVAIFRDLWRVLRDDGTCWINLGDSYCGYKGVNYGVNPQASNLQKDSKIPRSHMIGTPQTSNLKSKDLVGIPWMVAFALRADGWYLRSDIIWHKCLSGGTVVYAKTQKGEMPMTIKDMIKLDPATVKLWTGEKWSQVIGWNETPPNPDRKLDSQKRRSRKYKTGEVLPPSGELEIHLRSGEKIGCTQDHKFPTQRGLIEAGELKTGDILQTCLLPEPKKPVMPKYLPDETGWLVGLYLAEGSRSGETLQISGHKNETERWTKLEILANDYGDHFRLYTNGNGANAHIDGKMLINIIDTYINGKLAKGKHLSPDCWKRSNEFLSQVLQGYLDGDGHFDSNNNRWRIGFTKNDALAQDLRTLAGRLGFSLRLKRTKHVMNGRYFAGWRGQIRFEQSDHFNSKSDTEIVKIEASRARKFWDITIADEPHLFALASGVLTHNSNPMPESVTDRPTKAHEYIFLLTKSARYYYDQDAIREGISSSTLERWGNDPYTKRQNEGHNSQGLVPTQHTGEHTLGCKPLGRNKRSVWSISTKPYKKAHFATFPPDLIEPCVLAGCPPGGVVLDPFFGSGTVGEVCVRTGRRWLGVELNADYIALANERISRTQPALFPPGGIG